MQRSLGALITAFGALLIAYNPDRWDIVFLELPRGHGVHLHETIGAIAIVAGVVTLWLAPPRRS